MRKEWYRNVIAGDRSSQATAEARRSSSQNPPQIPRKKDQVLEEKGAMRDTVHTSRIGVWAALALTACAVATFASDAAPQPIAVSSYSSMAAANCWSEGPGRVEDSP